MSIDVVTLSAAFITGLAGSGHCMLMCGGIATALGAATQGESRTWRPALTLNLARVSGYTLAGLLVGLLGAAAGAVFAYAQIAWLMRGLLGLTLVLIGLRTMGAMGDRGVLGRMAQSFWQRLSRLRRWFLPADTVWRRWALGMLWGWLPCGLSSSVLAAAWFTADAFNGALTMTAFGLGTLPAMVPLTYTGMRWPGPESPMRRVAGLIVIVAGIVVLLAPWLADHPTLAAGLRALGCLPG